MDKLTRLWQMTDEMDIYTDFAPLTKTHPKLLGLYISSAPAIILDESLRHRRRTQKCILAEEIGHHHTAPRTDIRRVHQSYRRYGECNETITMAQDERRALLWATDFLMPDVELSKALSEGCRSCYELAEWFQVTEWMVYKKMGFLKACFRKQGIRVIGREIFRLEYVEEVPQVARPC